MHFILFGGKQVLLNFSKKILKKNHSLIIVSNRSLLNEIINSFGSLKKNLKKNNIKYFEFIKLSEKKIKPLIKNNTIGISLSARWIFNKNIIKLFRGNLYNSHYSLLPQYRGGGIYSWLIMSEQKIGGITIHKVNTNIDQGEICLQKKIYFPKKCILPKHFIEYVEKIEIELLLVFLNLLNSDKKINMVKQNMKNSSYWPRLNASLNGYINWQWNTIEITKFIRAFDDPYKGSLTFYKGNKIKLKKVQIEKDKNIKPHPFFAGLIIRKNNHKIFVLTVDGLISINEVIDSKNVDIKNKIILGERFYTPYKSLEKSMLKKYLKK